jgi:hypothetical protein
VRRQSEIETAVLMSLRNANVYSVMVLKMKSPEEILGLRVRLGLGGCLRVILNIVASPRARIC